MYSTKLALLIRNICSGSYSPCELIEFVNISQKMAVSYLKYQEVTGKTIRLDRQGLENNLEDMAIDCIATLFSRNDQGEFVQLQRYFKDFLSNGKDVTETQLVVKLRGLILRKTKQELSRIFRERDPEGAKVIRNIKVALKSSRDLGSFKENGREFIFSLDTIVPSTRDRQALIEKYGKSFNFDSDGLYLKEWFPNLRRQHPAIPERILRQKFMTRFAPNDPTSTMLRKLLLVVAEEKQYQNFLALDLVIAIIKSINQELFRERMAFEIEFQSPLDNLQLKEIQRAAHETINFIANKIEGYYLSKEKLSREKGQVYFNTLVDLIQDLAEGKNHESNFDYLKRHIPDLTQRQYREQERVIFEYLVKLSKTELRKKLKKLL